MLECWVLRSWDRNLKKTFEPVQKNLIFGLVITPPCTPLKGGIELSEQITCVIPLISKF
jgi:hypothetical protein